MNPHMLYMNPHVLHMNPHMLYESQSQLNFTTVFLYTCITLSKNFVWDSSLNDLKYSTVPFKHVCTKVLLKKDEEHIK